METLTDDGALTVALLKGRVFPEARDLLERAGLEGVGLLCDSRRLVWTTEGGWRYLLVRPHDVVTCVREGVADVGLVGKDVLLEDSAGVYEVLDLGIGACRLSVAGPSPGACGWPEMLTALGNELRVATRYPRATREYFARRGYSPYVIQLSGAVELAPQVGLADVIVDLVATGRTLQDNHLVEYEVIGEITARLVVNIVSFRWKAAAVQALCDRLARVCSGRKEVHHVLPAP
ncbi:MAG: ATP phosphoribosyltransferase [Bacillota bacterium]|nr:ATP phosphoribosyltransferase [Bacillota bacterium]